MWSRELAALVDRYGLPAGADRALLELLRSLTEDPHAPTSVRDPERVLRDHLADSLSALELPVIRAARELVDIGSGAGLPGIPLAIALPSAHVCLLEANGRKCEFMTRAGNTCGLGNVEVIHGRAETWSDGLDRFDAVTARALARLDVVAEYAAPLLRIGGALVAWRGRRDPADEAAGRIAAERLGLEVSEPLPVAPYAGAEHRHLHVLRKVSPTPAGFPRRPGIARKRPLAAAARSAGTSDRDRR